MSEDEQRRVQRIKEYVRARLKNELSNGARGAQARLAKKLGVSGAHLSNMLSSNPTRQPGEGFRRKVAAHWQISYAQLEALALGEEAPDLGKRSSLGSEIPPSLGAVLADYSWMPDLPPELRSIVREQARTYRRIGCADYSIEDWQTIVTGLERAAMTFLAQKNPRANHTATPRPPKTLPSS